MATIKESLTVHMKEAMKDKDALRLSVIRLLKSAVKYEEISIGAELDDEKVLGIIQREIKKHKESIEGFKKGNREELAQKEEAEMAILYEYLPEQADEEEIRLVVKGIVDQIPPDAKINMGMIMPKALALLKGRADGKAIGKAVNGELALRDPGQKV